MNERKLVEFVPSRAVLDSAAENRNFGPMNAVLTEDGQLAIPHELREQLGLKAGSILELQNQAGTLVA